ncbi:MAG: DNA repair protein RecN [Clostridia bacterium]|nr:DNA repair protein RecN [Clostridia bacterium]
MLSSLSLSNVALIKKQTIDFKSGFNCLLGQSGAGKSIVIDALSFSLGAKADKGLIRSGESALRVDAVFSDVGEEQKQLLQEWEIDCEDELIITRTLTQEGKSAVKINGFPATVKMLQQLAEKLVDFCGQHDSVGLLNANNHLAFLDKFVGVEVEKLKDEAAGLYDEIKEIEKKIFSLGGNEAERAREKEILEFQIQEIEEAHLELAEEEELKERFEFISASEKIFEKVSEVLNKLDGQRDNASALVYESKGDLSSFSNFKDIEECRARLENCYYELKDIVDVLESVRDNTDFDPRELERIDARLDLIKKLSRKYGKTVEDILDFQEQCKKKLDEIENSAEMLQKLNSQKQALEAKLYETCRVLSALRKKYAMIFEEQIAEQLDDLEMKGTYFKVDFAEGECTKKGSDIVKFMFSANKGQEIRDLHKTASGGELSRLLLAFKNVMLDNEMVQTVVFDEIDAGISGHTAGKLADKLVNISKFTQIICITHTPVVASKADEFLLVEKNVVGDSTVSTVTPLDEQQSVHEVARLLDGGETVSETAIEHAKKLFEGK